MDRASVRQSSSPTSVATVRSLRATVATRPRIGIQVARLIVAASLLVVTSARVDAQAALTCGTPVNGVIATVGATVIYTFSGEAGDRLSLSLWTTASVDSGFGAQADVLRPDASSYMTGVSGLVDIGPLPVSGTYTVRLRDGNDYPTYGSGRGQYVVELQWRSPLAKACGVNALTCGQPATGTLATNGDTVVYSFAGEAGDRLSLSLWTTASTDSGFGVQADVFGPDDASWTIGQSGLADLPALPTTGTYTVRLRDGNDYPTYGSGRGQYVLELQWRAPLAKACGVNALTCGQPATGTLSTNGDTAVYSFTGEAGDRLSLSLWTTASTDSGFGVQADVFGPDGASWTIGQSGLVDMPSVPTTGTYTVRLRDGNDYPTYGSGRGQYVVELQWRSPLAKACGVNALTCGQPATGTLSTNGDTAVYSFTGEVGDRLSLSLWTTASTDSGFGVQADVFGPDGASWTIGQSGLVDLPSVPTTGTYVVRLRDGNDYPTYGSGRGQYVVELQWRAPLAKACGVNALTCGQPATGTLATNGDTAVYSFAGGAGDLLSLSLWTTASTDSGFGVQADVFGPDGASWTIGQSGLVDLPALPTTGTYTVRLRDGNDYPTYGSGRGQYVLEVQWRSPLAKVCGLAALTCGQQSTGVIATPGDTVIRMFSGQAGDRLSLQVSTTVASDSGFGAQADVFSPDGASWRVGVSGLVDLPPLPATGAYAIRVRDAADYPTYGSGRGQYSLTLQWLTGCPPSNFSAVTPSSGPLSGGTLLTLMGATVGAATSVSVGGNTAQMLSVLGPTAIVVRSPSAVTVGPRDVTVVTLDGIATLPNAFTYLPETITDVTVGDAGLTIPNGSNFLQPSLSADGRYVAYVATSDAVITGDTNGAPDVVVRDRATGEITRVSVATDGTPANGASGRPRISANGRYVAFWSEASNLVPGDTNGVRDVFVHDRDADGNGVFDETAPGATSTTRASLASNGTEADGASATDGDPYLPGEPMDGQLDLSPDGGWVVFRSLATSLVAGDTNGVADIFLHGMTSGQTTRVSVAADGTQADGASQSPGVSAGGRRVVFASSAGNLVAHDTNGVRDVFLFDRGASQIVRLSASGSGVEADGASDWPSIDDAGVEVAFATLARTVLPVLSASAKSQVLVATVPWPPASAITTGVGGHLVGDALVSIPDILRQIASGVLPPGAAAVQPGNGASTQPEVCGDGTCLGYATDATNLTPSDPDTNGTRDTLLQPIVTTATTPPAPNRVSKDTAGNQATEATTRVAVSGNGLVVAMESAAALTPRVAADNPTGVNVFVRAVPLALATITRTFARTNTATTVTLTGVGFQSGATVTFGTTPVSATVAGDGRSLTVLTPTNQTPGVVPVTVRNPDGSTAAMWQFTFLAPEETAPTGDADNDGLPDAWEVELGLNPNSAAGDEGASGDPDADGWTNLQEYQRQTHPRGTVTRYLAEGATSAFFTTRLGLANPGTQPVHAWLRFQTSDGTAVLLGVPVPAQASRSVLVNALAGLDHAEFATVIESDGVLAVHRTMTWDAVHGYGSHLEGAVPAPATRWYLAEGSTNVGFQLFYLLQNPNATPAEVEIRYLRPAGEPVVRTYTVPAGARYNVWANTEAALARTDLSAVVTAINGVPIIVERAMYLDTAGQTFGAGHESAGVTAPATRWFLAEGATGSYFDLFILLANPSGTPATVTATYLLPSGATVTKTYVVDAQRRFTVWVDQEDARLADTAVSTTLVSDVPILAERAMWWPGGYETWIEAHNSFGATATGTLWALGGGEASAAPASADTYVLVANTSATPATVAVTVLFEDGTPAVTRTFAVAATSRFNVDVAAEFPGALGKRFGAAVESLEVNGQPAAQIVVETANYHNDSDGHVWAAGANALATRIR